MCVLQCFWSNNKKPPNITIIQQRQLELQLKVSEIVSETNCNYAAFVMATQ